MAKASRVAARTASTMASLEDRMAVMEARLERIETLLIELHTQGMVSREEIEDTLTTKAEHAEAFAAARKPKAGAK